MHIVLMILGVLAAGGFWWYRMRAASDAANEVIDMAGRVRGSIRRKRIRKQNEMSPLTAINDPVVAAATLITALATDDVALSVEREAATRDWLGEIATDAAADEAMIYGKWAAAQIDDAGTVIDKLGLFLGGKLTDAEKHGLLEKAREILKVQGPELVAREVRLRRLTQKLGLEVR